MLARYEKSLNALDRRHRLRQLSLPNGVDFASNDYLALSQAPSMKRAVIEALERGVAIGAGASRLLRGNHPEHEALEDEAAAFFKAEKALFFGTGYSANVALLSALPQRDDLVVFDAFIHASSHEGMRSGRAEFIAAAHNDVNSFAGIIRTWREKGNTGQVWIVVESLYSMDGDQAPLSDLMSLAGEHDAFLIIDEAHATGVFGTEGRGLAAGFEGKENLISLHTCGKALGAMGALVCAPKPICDFLINRARSFIYSTAPSPIMAVAVLHALHLLKTEPARRARLHNLIQLAHQKFDLHCKRDGSGSQIMPCIVGNDSLAMTLASAMQNRGYDIRGIRPPTVPEGTARLRISLTLHASETDISNMFEALGEELGKRGL